MFRGLEQLAACQQHLEAGEEHLSTILAGKSLLATSR